MTMDVQSERGRGQDESCLSERERVNIISMSNTSAALLIATTSSSSKPSSLAVPREDIDEREEPPLDAGV